MPPIIRQHVQPDLAMAAMQSQQLWIMAQHAASPLVQVMHIPISVGSHLHMPIVMLQVQTGMPFIIMQHEHRPPAIILQRFCSVAAATSSSQTQSIRIPPAHLSNVMVHFGTIIMPMPMPMPVPGIELPVIPLGIPIPAIPIIDRSIMTAPFISIPPA